MFLAYAAYKNFTIYQPEEFEDTTKPNHVYILDKALYGLKKAPRACYDELSTYLLKFSVKKGFVDATLLIKREDGEIVLI